MHQPSLCKIGRKPKLTTGFTLIELIIGVVVLAFAFSLIATLIYPQAIRSAEPVLQIRASNLAQAFIAEIQSKAFDENNSQSGGSQRCGESGAPPCSTSFGPEGETRDQFDDVDDFHQLEVSQPNLADVLGANLADDYRGFEYAIDVCYSDLQGTCDDAAVTPFKRVQVRIATSQSQDFVFSIVKGNY